MNNLPLRPGHARGRGREEEGKGKGGTFDPLGALGRGRVRNRGMVGGEGGL